MLFKVLQISDEKFGEISCQFENDKIKSLAEKELDNGSYTEVCSINMEENKNYNLIDYLEDTFRMTNSIELPWYTNEYLEVSDYVSEKGGCRSTSKGDIVEFKDEKYIVGSIGFIKI